MTDQITTASLKRQAIFWLATTAAIIVFLYIFRSILLPFFAGLALAYFMDPVADFLERRGLSRLTATIVILLSFIILFVIALMVVVPVLATQLTEFIARLPTYLVQLQTLVASASVETGWLSNYLGIDPEALQSGVDALLNQSAGFLTTLFQGIWSSGKAVLDVAGLLIVAPVVAFYMLLDWDKMIAKVDSWIPRNHVDSVRRIGRDVNVAIAGFVRGQGTVCLILGLFYAIGLTIVGLNFGLLIGLFAGLISFIPYVGSLVGLVLSLGVALVQFWPDWIMIAIVAAIFFAGQAIEGNFLQPKLVGDSVGLHPVWLMFALFAFGSLFGFTGLLIAVPAAAAVGVLVRFALEKYLDSDLYAGKNKPGKATK
ncbi:AI-2E family transporter [Oricola cellulosilytica]|uniref:AI-2E family transporter n=1 Tax=Oricola cellulosilytica TaxID=1429082 RepID=A0A4R0PAR9_9HYPH|nr:AI-2E family transporter [Oricola cellulosilytica]TCD14331.1 AI-2E family transporter [Oricola cellulosilytica]